MARVRESPSRRASPALTHVSPTPTPELETRAAAAAPPRLNAAPLWTPDDRAEEASAAAVVTHVSPTPTPELETRAAAAAAAAPSSVAPELETRAAAAAAAAPSSVAPQLETRAAVAPPARTKRPLRLRVRKLETQYLDAIEAGSKRYEVTQTRYLGGAHAWTLGWDLRTEVADQLWVGLSPVGRQDNGHFVVTHFACLQSCDVLDGVSCWLDVSRLAGSGISTAAAKLRDANPKTALDPTRQTYAWRFRPGSIHTLHTPVAIDAFCGPWAEAALREVDTQDMPLDMYNDMTFSLVPTRISRKRGTVQQMRAAGHEQENHEEHEADDERPRAKLQLRSERTSGTARLSSRRRSPWDHERTVLALSLHQALRDAEPNRNAAAPSPPPCTTEERSTTSQEEDENTEVEVKLFHTPPLDADGRRADVKHRDACFKASSTELDLE